MTGRFRRSPRSTRSIRTQVGAWKRQAMEGLVEVFSKGAEHRRRDHESEVRDLHAKIGGADRGAGFFVARVRSMSRAERRAMVVRDHPALSLSRQCRLLSLGRSSLYYEPKGESAETLALMRRIDELFLKYPFYGARRMALHLRREGVRIGRRRAGRLMRLMGSRQSIGRHAPARPTPSTGSTLICCGAWRSSGRTMSGAPTSPISR